MRIETIIRQAKPGDENNLIKMFRVLYQESDFLLMESDEFDLTAEKQARLIEEYTGSNLQVLFVAENSGTIVGFLGGTGGNANRNRHTIHIAMGVLEKHQGKGIGRQLLLAFIDWAISNQFNRIELTVIESNTKAKALYESMEFEIEGLKRNALKVNGNYINEHYMAKLI